MKNIQRYNEAHGTVLSVTSNRHHGIDYRIVEVSGLPITSAKHNLSELEALASAMLRREQQTVKLCECAMVCRIAVAAHSI